jgi:anti-sigma regulatory factor (Ser/Thr protein kinase)
LELLELTLHNLSSDVPLAHQALDQFSTQNSLPIPDLAKLHVAIEEILTNIISYGYDPGQSGTIRIRFALESSALCVEVEDDARPFNPMKAPEVDISLPLDQKPIGGLGVHLIRNNVDSLSYRRAGKRNVLVLIKRLP